MREERHIWQHKQGYSGLSHGRVPWYNEGSLEFGGVPDADFDLNR